MSEYLITKYSSYASCRKKMIQKHKISKEFFDHVWLDYANDIKSGKHTYPRVPETAFIEVEKKVFIHKADTTSKFFDYPSLPFVESEGSSGIRDMMVKEMIIKIKPQRG